VLTIIGLQSLSLVSNFSDIHILIDLLKEEQFLRTKQNRITIKMHSNINGKDLQSLLSLYNQEIDKLKEKLLNGESWENLKPQRANITELAIAIQKLHGYVVTNKIDKEAKPHVAQSSKLADEAAG